MLKAYAKNNPRTGWITSSSAVGSRMYTPTPSIKAENATFPKRIVLSNNIVAACLIRFFSVSGKKIFLNLFFLDKVFMRRVKLVIRLKKEVKR